MKKNIFLFMLFIPLYMANARTLHVGDKTFTLSQTKYTSPSLNFLIDGEQWYASMVPVFIDNTLHLEIGASTYSVINLNCAETFTDTENYTYDENGRLIGANENLWIQENTQQGQQNYIDTGFVATGNTRIKTKFYNTTNSAKWFFGARAAVQNNAFGLQCAGPSYNVRNDYGNEIRTISGAKCGTLGIFIVDKNKNITTLQHPNGRIYTADGSSGGVKNFSTRYNVPIMAFGEVNNTILPIRNKFYYFKIYSDGADENSLVRDMVPVPACMRIGDFVVPENGMWDIVNQQFYGNSGTGNFIYGKDE